MNALNTTAVRISTVGAMIVSLILSLAPISTQAAGYGGNPGGGGGSGGVVLSTQKCEKSVERPTGGFSASVEDSADSLVKVRINGGDAARVTISESPTLEAASQIPFAAEVTYALKNTDEGQKQLYVRLYNACGLPTEIFSTSFLHAKAAVRTGQQGKSEQENQQNSGTGGTGGNKGGVTGLKNGPKGRVLGERVVLVDQLIAKLRFGQRGDDVTRLQSELKRLGFLKIGRLTRYYGPLTRAAVKAYLNSLK